MARAAQQRHRPVRGPAFLSSPERALVWAYAQQHGPNEPHDEDELANLRWHAAAFVRRAQKVFADGGVRLYRAVLLPRRWP